MTEKVYTVDETCEILKISRPTFFRWEKAGKIKVIRVSPRIMRISESEINRLLGDGE